MARVTVEDCINKVPNRFKLVLMAAKRARDIERGAKPSVVRDNDKSTVLALREIAEDAISIENLEEITKQSIINNETELSYEQEEEERLQDINVEEIDDDDLIDDEDFLDDDDDWNISDNPYNRTYSSDSEDTSDEGDCSDEEISDELDYNSQDEDFLEDDNLSNDELSSIVEEEDEKIEEQ